MSKVAVEVIVEEVATNPGGTPKVRYTIIIPRKNGQTELRGTCKLGEAIKVYQDELNG